MCSNAQGKHDTRTCPCQCCKPGYTRATRRSRDAARKVLAGEPATTATAAGKKAPTGAEQADPAKPLTWRQRCVAMIHTAYQRITDSLGMNPVVALEPWPIRPSAVIAAEIKAWYGVPPDEAPAEVAAEWWNSVLAEVEEKDRRREMAKRNMLQFPHGMRAEDDIHSYWPEQHATGYNPVRPGESLQLAQQRLAVVAPHVPGMLLRLGAAHTAEREAEALVLKRTGAHHIADVPHEEKREYLEACSRTALLIGDFRTRYGTDPHLHALEWAAMSRQLTRPTFDWATPLREEWEAWHNGVPARPAAASRPKGTPRKGKSAPKKGKSRKKTKKTRARAGRTPAAR